MIHIITSGCSFTESGDYQSHLLNDLQNQNIDFTIHNIGRGSAGNHIIKHLFYKKITELLNDGVDLNVIFSTIQLSGILRPTWLSSEFQDVTSITDEWRYDYDETQNFNTIEDIRDLYLQHIKNIEELINFCKNKKLKTKIFWGWEVMPKYMLNEYNLLNEFENLDKMYLKNFSTDIKNYKKKGITREPLYTEYRDKIYNGGMIEVALHYSDSKDIYKSKEDAHLNQHGHRMFYDNFYRKFFQEWKILT